MTRLYTVTYEEVSQGDIDEKRLFLSLVVGAPRSGTTMMVSILEALGIKMLWTEEASKELAFDWMKKFLENLGRPDVGFKIPLRTGANLWCCVEYLPCRVIVMRRDAQEVVRSQASLNYPPVPARAVDDIVDFHSMLITKYGKPKLEVNYNDTLADPETNIAKVAEFVGKTVTDKALAVVRPDLYHFKNEALEQNGASERK